MSIQNNKFCTLHDDKHFLLPCGGNSCKICLLEIKEKILKCFHCNKDFDKNDLIKDNPTFDDVLSNLKSKLKATLMSLQGK
jgi:hypothetical protein